MRIKNVALYNELESQLINFSNEIFNLPGIFSNEIRSVFIMQLIDSIRRVEYVYTICRRDISESRADPTSDFFDPLKAAILFKKENKIDEAFWLVFLYVHFSKNIHSGWRLLRDVYGCLGNINHWTWERISSHPYDFRNWVRENYETLKDGSTRRSFGNHRKFETLKPDSSKNTAFVVESYVNWINPPRTHEGLIREMENSFGSDPRILFEKLFNSMNSVFRFGRLAKFDYLTMIAKLGLASIEPGKTYIKDSTGPLLGAQLLFYNNVNHTNNSSILEEKLASLENNLSLGRLGMQVLEDALCNWQKSPQRYKYFSG